MGKLNIQSFPSPDETMLYAGYALNKLLEGQKEKPVLLMLSGGSSLQILEGVNMENIGEKTSVTMLDERFSENPEINNFLQLQKTDFYKEALDKGCSFFGTLPRPKELPEQMAQRLENNLKQWKQENPKGKVFAVLGMGEDGHTAGIMPFPENELLFKQLFEREKWAVSYDASGKNKHTQRVTSTITFLKMLDRAVAFVSGKNKQPAFERLAAKQNTIAKLPAMVWHDIKNLEVYTDINLEQPDKKLGN